MSHTQRFRTSLSQEVGRDLLCSNLKTHPAACSAAFVGFRALGFVHLDALKVLWFRGFSRSYFLPVSVFSRSESPLLWRVFNVQHRRGLSMGIYPDKKGSIVWDKIWENDDCKMIVDSGVPFFHRQTRVGSSMAIAWNNTPGSWQDRRGCHVGTPNE